MMEGKGPMVIDSVWSNEKEAWKYANSQGGVCGRPGPWNKPGYNDWEVHQHRIYDTIEEIEKEYKESIK